MIDLESFSRQLGAPRTLGPDDHLALGGGVRVLCDGRSWTLLLDELSVDEDSMRKVFDLSRETGPLVPMTTRSGHLAIRFLASDARDDTAPALHALRILMASFRGAESGLSESAAQS